MQSVDWVRCREVRDHLMIKGLLVFGAVRFVEMKRGAVELIEAAIQYAKTNTPTRFVPQLFRLAEQAAALDEWVGIGCVQFNPDDASELTKFNKVEGVLSKCIPRKPTEAAVRKRLRRRGITKERSIDIKMTKERVSRFKVFLGMGYGYGKQSSAKHNVCLPQFRSKCSSCKINIGGIVSGDEVQCSYCPLQAVRMRGREQQRPP